MKLIVQIPCLNEEETLPLVARLDPAPDPRHRRRRDPGHRRRLHGPHGRGRPGARRRPLRQHTRATGAWRARSATASTTRCGTAPTSSSTPTATTSTRRSGSRTLVAADPRRPRGHRHRRPADAHRSSTSRRFKKLLQRVGSRVVNWAAGTDLPDAASGFRAYSREAAAPAQRRHAISATAWRRSSRPGDKRLRDRAASPSTPTPRRASRGSSRTSSSTSPAPAARSCAATRCSARTRCSCCAGQLLHPGRSAALPAIPVVGGDAEPAGLRATCSRWSSAGCWCSSASCWWCSACWPTCSPSTASCMEDVLLRLKRLEYGDAGGRLEAALGGGRWAVRRQRPPASSSASYGVRSGAVVLGRLRMQARTYHRREAANGGAVATTTARRPVVRFADGPG